MQPQINTRPSDNNAREYDCSAPAPSGPSYDQAQPGRPHEGRVIAGKGILWDVRRQGMPEPDHEGPGLVPDKAESLISNKGESGRASRCDQSCSALLIAPDPEYGQEKNDEQDNISCNKLSSRNEGT